MDLPEIKTTTKKPYEPFLFNGHSLDFKLIDFWSWNQSDLIENRNRGILAEFIVQKALRLLNTSRLEWDSYDLKTEEGIKIEVKSAAYIQAWKQKKYSTISFGIAPTSKLLDNNDYSLEKSRQADIYIFCLLEHREQATLDPMNLDQWVFYILTTKTLNEKFPNQKSISLSTIESIENNKCKYGEIKERFDKIKNCA
jgi:hypothetical protein